VDFGCTIFYLGGAALCRNLTTFWRLLSRYFEIRVESGTLRSMLCKALFHYQLRFWNLCWEVFYEKHAL
jgi:hypothetical protein